jgi:hypothetical protein
LEYKQRGIHEGRELVFDGLVDMTWPARAFMAETWSADKVSCAGAGVGVVGSPSQARMSSVAAKPTDK